MDLVLRPVSEPVCQLFDNGYLVGDITSMIQLSDIRCQVLRQKKTGCYLIWEGIRINIKPNGECEKWPRGFYDEFDFLTLELLGAVDPYQHILSDFSKFPREMFHVIDVDGEHVVTQVTAIGLSITMPGYYICQEKGKAPDSYDIKTLKEFDELTCNREDS